LVGARGEVRRDLGVEQGTEVGVVPIAEEVEEVFVLDGGKLEFEEVALAVSAGSWWVGKELSKGRGDVPRVHVYTVDLAQIVGLGLCG
jgi:hypothetical protein